MIFGIFGICTPLCIPMHIPSYKVVLVLRRYSLAMLATMASYCCTSVHVKLHVYSSMSTVIFGEKNDEKMKMNNERFFF